ncbi:MAG TPA: AMP-binding protein, partial [Ktedonobacteraceae bacterium]|nr:AMP-binding protein [Ktedonobacteraceae bacterium]
MDVHLHDLVSIARHRAANTPNQLVYRFLSEHADQAKELTFAELDRQAQQIAALLQAHSLSTGSRVLLLFSPGLEYIVAFWGCLYAGAVAVPVYPPRKTRSQRFAQRFQQILQDAEATVALTTSTLAPLIASPVPGSPQQAQPFLLLTTDTLPASLVWQEQSFSGSQLAFLQYTSGTTSEPRGVMLTHENVVSNLASIYRAFGLSPESRGVIWLPPYHDMGLIGGILEPLYGGFPVTLMAPTTFLQKPVRWLEAISQTQATNSGGPNFAYDLCTQRISDEQKARLDLSHWKLAFNGAEPVRPSTMEQFSRAFASCGFRFQAFYPCYGLAEATLLVSGKLIAEASSMRQVDARALENHAVLSPAVGEQHDVRELVACGQVDDEQTLLIVDPVTCQPLPDLQVGEVWLQGPGIAKGYWKRPDLTATTFQAQVNDGRTIQQPFLRTGDLGFLDEGQLYVTGRLKDLIIIRGRNYYPQDIEMTAGRCHESLEVGNGAAFALTQDGEERLVVVHEVVRTQRHGPLDEVIYALKRAIAEEHGIAPYAVVLIRNGSLPRTTSGKIQRNLCRTQYLQRLLQVLREETVEEGSESAPVINRVQLLQAPYEQRPALLADALRAQVAHLIQAPVIDEHRQIPLTALGLDSMQCVALTAQIFRDFQVTIELDALLDGMSLDQLFQSVSSQLEDEGQNWKEEEEHGASSSEYEQQLSYGQQALWLTQRATAQNYAYTLRRV